MTNATLQYDNKQKTKLLSKLPEIIKRYIISMESKSTTIKSQIAALREINAFLKFVFTDKRLSDLSITDFDNIKSDDIEDYLSYLRMIGNSGATMATKYAILKSWFDYMHRKGIVSKDIFFVLNKPKAEVSSDNNPFTDEEIQQMFIDVYNHPNEMIAIRDAAMLSTLLCTGIRISELVNLDVKDIDLKNNKIYIVRKGGKKSGYIPCSSEWNKYITDWMEYREKTGIKSNALFTSKKSDRLLKAGVSRRINEITGYNAHKFRKTCGSKLYEQTGDIYLVADLLGHSNIETTTKSYVNANKTKLDEAMGTLIYDI